MSWEEAHAQLQPQHSAGANRSYEPLALIEAMNNSHVGDASTSFMPRPSGRATRGALVLTPRKRTPLSMAGF
jgi:hypothetical protein